MHYVYRIQWAFWNPKTACKVVSLLGARSFDKIVFRGKDGEKIDYYTGFLQFDTEPAIKETNKYIRKMFRSGGANRCELVRK